jgi:hypothetical protein
MSTLLPFTTALPPQNDYSDYVPGNPDARHQWRTDETERLAAEKQEDPARKPDDDLDEQYFSKVLGMLLNAAVTAEKSQPLKTEAPALAESSQTSPLPESSQTSPLPESSQTSPLPESSQTSPLPESSQTSPLAESSQTSPLPVQFLSPAENTLPDPLILSYSTLGTAGPQVKIETTFLSGIRPYESVKDTDDVTQEIMNALSRGVAASAPTTDQSGVGGLQPGVSGVGLSAISNFAPLAPLATERISPVNSFGTSLRDSSEEILLQASREQTTGLENSQGQVADQFRILQLGSDADRGSNQAASRDNDTTMGNPASATSSGPDGIRLSSSGALTFTLPDLTSSVTSEMRQPLSSQVSRAVLEYIERRTTADSDTITVRLDPPDLGEMVIELSKSKEGLSVRVTAREAVTMDMLLARGSEIETQLRGEKMDLRSLEFLSPDMMNGGAFQGQSSQDSTSRFDQPVGIQRRTSRNASATQIATGAVNRTGDSQHSLNFRA